MTRVSVVIPCYNYAEYIEQAVKSVLGQLRDPDELIVIDDGSTDDIRLRLESYIRENAIRYVYQDNAGVSAARNRGAREAGGEYLYFLDADDCVVPGGLDELREYVDKNPGCDMVFAGHITVDATGKRSAHHQRPISDRCEINFVDYVIRRRFSIANGGTALVRREVILANPFPETIRVSEDFCVFAWILANYRCCTFANPVVEIRKHDRSLRNQLPLYEQAVQKLPGILFDPEKLPQALLVYRQPFVCNRLLSLFRAQYLSGDRVRARKTYLDAIKCRPSNLFKLPYLRKYLRLLLAA